MRILRSVLLCVVLVASARASYTEFYVHSTGSNLNAGSTSSDAAVFTAVGDSDGTSVFTPSDGSTPASSVNVGDWASVYVTAGATVATFVGRVTAVAAGVNGAITVSTTAKAGTFPAASSGAHTITLRTGGAWAGPNGTVAFPFAFAAGTMTDASGDTARVNFNNDATYSVSAAMTSSTNGTIRWEGYSAAPGDGGRAKIDGGTGTAYTLLTVSGTDQTFAYLWFNRNGDTGGGSPTQGVSTTGARSWFYRCVISNMRAAGFYSASNQSYYIECEAYACNASNTSDRAAFYVAVSGSVLNRCVSHDNVGGSNANGFGLDQTVSVINCVSYNNAGCGYYSKADQYNFLLGCDAYNNTGDGYWNDTATTTLILVMQNCNFVKNGGYGIRFTNTQHPGVITNCGFGSGTMANTNGQIIANAAPIVVSGSITYASGVTPWNAPASGDFKITLSAAENSGVGAFLQTTTTPINVTVGYPDVGAATHAASASSGGLRTTTFILAAPFVQ